jgi:hypothetical protein
MKHSRWAVIPAAFILAAAVSAAPAHAAQGDVLNANGPSSIRDGYDLWSLGFGCIP